jgi:hypothetical protein
VDKVKETCIDLSGENRDAATPKGDTADKCLQKICTSLFHPKTGDCDYHHGKISVCDIILAFSGHDKMFGT